MSLPLTKKVEGLLIEVKSAAHAFALELERLEQEVFHQRKTFEASKGSLNAPDESHVNELEAKFQELKKHAALPAANKIEPAAPNDLQAKALASLDGAESTSPPEVIALVEKRNQEAAAKTVAPVETAPAPTAQPETVTSVVAPPSGIATT